MRILNLFFIILFLASAALQYNDPDPYLWVPIYLFGAWLCYQALKGKFQPAMYYIGWAVYGGYALYLFFDRSGVLSWWRDHHAESIVQSMKATRPWIEETREFGGLLLLLFAISLNWLWARYKLKS
ncbi:transmembrane 220 family protein [Flavihumibacter petaseus]|uniref:Transmembrane protein n=1 Tax=Flavihumibacter petaseus NBRC 106054 TaxID=1220578 RepID=A0A0E9MV98_9BACT|nr:transmembrane 220 family protein [Flavihumibacter petaseus]GAO41682.1 hypothetical protein FPE01S_01_06960 [Flavihumibacter petaseus NBRC 106054]